MKLRRIFAAVAACAIAATSVISASAYTADVTGDLGMKDAVTLGTEEAQGNWALNLAAPGVLDGVKAEDIYGASVTFTKASIDNYIAEAAGVGGGFVWNTTDGWAQKEWGNADAKKEITLDDENRTITRLDEEPCFTADSVSGAEGTWGQVVVVLWWGPKAGMEIESVSLLGKDGSVLKTFGASVAAPAPETPKDDPASSEAPKDDSNKPTGATAGLALAGLAIAGVAVVASKKSK